VGDSNELKSLDELHSRLKRKTALGRKLAPDEKLRHQQLVSTLQATVLSKRSELTCTIKMLEREHFGHYSRLPLDPKHAHIVAARSYVTKLLHKWEILLWFFVRILLLFNLVSFVCYIVLYSCCIILLVFVSNKPAFLKATKYQETSTVCLLSY